MKMEWFNGSVHEAVSEAKRNNKLFLVYIEGPDDMSKDMTNTYNDVVVSQKLSAENIVAIKLAANSVPYVQFCAIYPVLIIPSSYFIGVNGAPIEIITGSLVPTEFAAKIDKIIEIHEKFSPAAKSAASCQPSSSKDSVSSIPSEVNSPDPSQPSTSQASEDAASSVPLEDRLERAKVLLEVKKQIKEEEEKEKEKQLELERRNVGKALQKAQQEKQDNELKEWARNRAKEKEEERLAREKVRALIAQDRAERAARYQQYKEDEQEKDRIAKVREEQDRNARAAALNSNDARIQFRLPDGSSTNHVFPADASLDDVRTFVRQEVRPPFSNFSLCTTFPRRHFTQSNYSESLRDLQLAPSAVLLILPENTVTHVHSTGSFWSVVFWSLMKPFIYSWRAITSFFSGAFQSREQPSPPTNSESSSKSSSEQSSSSPAGGSRRRDAGFVRREGNIFRLSNQSDDGENNTWNGNSTQQM